jgi:hypothetical protein
MDEKSHAEVRRELARKEEWLGQMIRLVAALMAATIGAYLYSRLQ